MGNKLFSCCWACEGDQTPSPETGDSSSSNSDNGLHHGSEGDWSASWPSERDQTPPPEMGDSSSINSDNGLHHGSEGGGSASWPSERDQTPSPEMGDSSSSNSDNGLHHEAEGGGSARWPNEGSFDEKYEIVENILLGEGSTSLVTKCRHRVTGKTFAVKVIDKMAVLDEFEDRHVSDVEMMSHLHHPNIIGFEEAFETTTQTRVVMELFHGVELSSHMASEGSLGEDVARDVILQIASALAHMHWMGIVHRDIKPENVLVDTSSCTVKVIDLGEADWVVADGMSLKTFWGTEAYIAPEIFLGGRFTFKADIWALGITAYSMMCGTLPSFDNNPRGAEHMSSETARKKLNLSFDPIDEGNLSWSARDFLQKLLAIDPQARYSAFQVLDHPWLVGEEPESADVNEVDLAHLT